MKFNVITLNGNGEYLTSFRDGRWNTTPFLDEATTYQLDGIGHFLSNSSEFTVITLHFDTNSAIQLLDAAENFLAWKRTEAEREEQLQSEGVDIGDALENSKDGIAKLKTLINRIKYNA